MASSQRVPWLATWLSSGLVVYVYAGYPLLLAIVATMSRRSGPTSGRVLASAPTSATLIICAHNEQGVIGDKLERTLNSIPPGTDVVVVADGSDDRTVAIAEGYADRGVRVLHSPERRGKAAALNRGAAVATGDVLLFSDANNDWAPDAAGLLLEVFQDRTVGGATGVKTVRRSDEGHANSERTYWGYESSIRRWENASGYCTAANGEIMAVRSDCFRPLPNDAIVDDLHLALDVMRQGRRFVCVADAVSSEDAARNESDELERRSRMAAGRAQMLLRRGSLADLPGRVVWQLLSHKVGRLFVPVAVVVSMSSLAALSFGPQPRTAARLGLGLHALVLGACVAEPVVGRHGPAAVRRIPALVRFVVLSNAAILRGLGRAALGKQSAMWERADR